LLMQVNVIQQFPNNLFGEPVRVTEDD